MVATIGDRCVLVVRTVMLGEMVKEDTTIIDLIISLACYARHVLQIKMKKKRLLRVLMRTTRMKF